MNRRKFCKTCIALSTLFVSGCLGRLDRMRSNNIDLPEIVADAEFEFSNGRHEESQEDPAIQVNTAEERAVINGTLLVGSGSCNEAVLDGITHTNDDIIEVVVTWEDTSEEGEVCTDDISSDQYEVRLKFESLPSAITVTEHDYRDDDYITTEVINIT